MSHIWLLDISGFFCYISETNNERHISKNCLSSYLNQNFLVENTASKLNNKINNWGEIRWKFVYTGSVTFFTITASHFHQISVFIHVGQYSLWDCPLPGFFQLRPHDLDCAVFLICCFRDAIWQIGQISCQSDDSMICS